MAPLVWLAGRLPLGLVLALGPALGRLAWLVAGHERRRALGNVERAFPGMDPQKRRRLVRGVFDSMGRGAMECAAMDRLRPNIDQPGGLVSFTDGSLAVLQQQLAQGRGVLFVTAHLGNWELLGAAVARQAPLAVLFAPSYDPRFTAMMTRFRQRSEIQSINVARPTHMLSVLRALRAGKVVGVLVDQPVTDGTPASFFGRPAPTSELVPALARRSGAAVVVGFIRRCEAGRHVASIRRLGLSADPGRATREINLVVQQAVAETPQQWLWTLDRWRDG